MDWITPDYKINIYIHGQLIGDIRKIATNFNWIRRRTIKGVDEINFTLNDVLFEKWLNDRNTNIADVLKPLALTCQVIRNGVNVVGGFLATMPTYSPNGSSANLNMKFDGWLNLLAGVYIYPTPTMTGEAGAMFSSWIQLANTRSSNAGNGYGFTEGVVDTFNSITQTFDGYKTVKDALCDRADNVSGAGMFDVYIYDDKVYDIKRDNNFGVSHNYIINYPTQLTTISATSISADEVSGFASKVIALGAGETSSDSDKSTVITAEASDNDAISEYGYFETLYQDSSISRQTTLNGKATSVLANTSYPLWSPKIQISGRYIAPAPSNSNGEFIWIGDYVTLDNKEDLTGQTSGIFRVQELNVRVTESNAENIAPTLERV